MVFIAVVMGISRWLADSQKDCPHRCSVTLRNIIFGSSTCLSPACIKGNCSESSASPVSGNFPEKVLIRGLFLSGAKVVSVMDCNEFPEILDTTASCEMKVAEDVEPLVIFMQTETGPLSERR
jgi:hypothetical protein